MKQKSIDILKNRLQEIAHLSSALAVLNWDREVHMPKNALELRAASLSNLSSIVHAKSISLDDDGLLTNLKKDFDAGKLLPSDAVIVGETWRSFSREKKLPVDFVREHTETCAKAQYYWAEARKKNDFALFLPWLKKIVELKRKEASLVGYKVAPYDALIDVYEPNMTGDKAAIILNELKDFLIPLLKKIKKSPRYKDPSFDKKRLLGIYDEAVQREFTHYLSEKMGFDFDAGAIEKSTHPFTTSFSPNDVRFTTRYNIKDILESIGATIHEAGHALYEQGLLPENFGTPLGEAVSLGIHESQSRLWENCIGKSREFWQYFFPRLQKDFPVPFKKLSLDTFYAIINQVKPSLIRIEADEVTYNLHIIIRFELEREMINGQIDIASLPKLWKEKVKEYLGINVPKDSLGVLQDVHWSCGLFGYFPTYAFGNIYSAQLFDAMKKEIPNYKKKIAAGNLAPFREWLRLKVHAHGKMFTADALIENATGNAPQSSYFKEYIESKYGELYKL